tara:strand:- start:3653 stop:4006 length:354 start_codon:yes stop_codon:yes gene_type:complete
MPKFEAERIKDSDVYFIKDESCSLLNDEETTDTLIKFFEKNQKIGFAYTDILISKSDCSYIENIMYSDALPEMPFFMRYNPDIDLEQQNFTAIMMNIFQRGLKFSHIPVVGCEINAS